MAASGGGLAAFALALLGPVPWALAHAAWVRREPRAAVVLWQSLGLATGLAAVGAIGAFSRGTALLLAGWLLGVTALAAARTLRSRRRHRELVDLVSTPFQVPGPARATTAARVVDHPAATAYCLPGPHSRVVVTTGALALLSGDELDAVLAHEHAHLAEHHDLVLLPFAGWAAALPWLPGPRQARVAVHGLVEMVADDRACIGRERRVLAAALSRVGAAGVPLGAVGATNHVVLARVRRLLEPPDRSWVTRTAAYCAAAALLLVPVALIVL